MKQEFKYKGIHFCEAVVLACIDFRFWKKTMKFVEGSPPAGGLGIKSYDFPKMPGAAKRSEERRVGKECRSRWSPYH